MKKVMLSQKKKKSLKIVNKTREKWEEFKELDNWPFITSMGNNLLLSNNS